MFRWLISLQKFVIVLLVFLTAIAVWSFYQSAPIGTIAIRVIAAAVILQLLYFTGVLIMVNKRKNSKREPPTN